MIIVILLVAILSVTALPKFVNLSDEAKSSVVAGLAAELTAQSKLNFLGYQLSGVFSLSPAAETRTKVISTVSSAGYAIPSGACATLLAGTSGFNNITISPATAQTAAFATGLPGGISIVNDTMCGTGAVSIGKTATCQIQDLAKTYISATAYVLCTN